MEFTDQSNAIRHGRAAHGDKKKPTKREIPCPRANEEDCKKMFLDWAGARAHSKLVHGSPEAGDTFIAAWPTSPDIPLRDADGERIPGWDKLPTMIFLDSRWVCPDQGCSRTHLDPSKLKNHYLAIHMRARWPCQYAERFSCDKMFSSIYDAKEHADEHYAKSRWVCQYPRCLSQIQGRRQRQVAARAHNNRHVQRGHFKKGECEPLEVRDNERTNEHHLKGITGLEIALR